MIKHNQTENDPKNGAGASESAPHASWFGAIMDRIYDLDVDFPLSGGEDGHPHVVKKHHKHVEAAPAVEVKQASAPVVKPTSEADEASKAPHESWFAHLIHKIQDLDVDFPLSGGEHPKHVH